MASINAARHCEEAKPTKQSRIHGLGSGLLRCARNDGAEQILHPVKSNQRRWLESKQLACVSPKNPMAERVLIVDDDPVQRRLLENMAAKAGYETVVVD